MPMISDKKPDDDDKGAKQSGPRFEEAKGFGFAKSIIALLAAIGAGFLVRRFKRSKDKARDSDAGNSH